MSDKYTTIYVTVPINDKGAIKSCAKANGETLNEFVRKAVYERMDYLREWQRKHKEQ